MSESTLSLARPELLRAVGMVAGWDRDPDNWTADQDTVGDDIINAACRKFYGAYDWSFLHIVTTIATVADDADQDLPDGFGKIESPFTYAAAQGFGPILERNEAWIRQQRQYDNSSGRPLYFAVRAKSSAATDGQRWEVMWYPIPAAAYTLGYRYWAHPGKLTAALPYPMGGMIHGETLKALVEAEVELQLGDTKGVRFDEAQRLLQQSQAWDAENASPTALGYVGDSPGDGEPNGRWPNYDYGKHGGVYSS